MKKKVFTMIALFSMIFGMCLGVVNNVYASDGIAPYSNVDGSDGTGSAYIISGKRSYLSTSTATASFVIGSSSSSTDYLLINISATNGTITDNVTQKVWLSPGTGKTSSALIKKSGIRFSGKFKPYNSQKNGYYIGAYAAYWN